MKYLFFICFIFSHLAFSQSVFTVKGTVKSADGETLIGASVQDKESKKGVITDINGYFELKLNAGERNLKISFVGYEDYLEKINLKKDISISISLKSTALELSGVEITGQSVAEKVDRNQMSVEQLSAKEAKLLPAIFGEVDILKTLQLKPGVQSGGEGSSGLYIRGGGTDQNLVLLDGATIYNPSHLFGFFSVFNSDAVEKIDLYKGDFPAEFGGRLSSVIDVGMRKSESKKLSATGGIGLIASRLTLEMPIPLKDKNGNKDLDKLTVLFSGRRTYIDVFTRQINTWKEGDKNWTPIPSYFFYDLNGKINFKLNKNNHIYWSGYLGRDVFSVSNGFEATFDWGNRASVLGWKHFFSPKLSTNTALVYSDYNYQLDNRLENFSINVSSRVSDFGLRNDWFWQANSKHSVKFGAIITHKSFDIGRFEGGNADRSLDFRAGTYLQGQEFGAYISDEIELNKKLKINVGTRISGFHSEGKYYAGFEPRFSARYKLNEKIAIKASYTQMYQYVHLVSNSAASLPTDIWYPSGEFVRPQRSQQAVLGYSLSLFGEKLFFSNEFYYKWLNNQIDYKDGAQIFFNDKLYEEFVFGKGWAYGTEFYLEKKTGKTQGWIGYTLSYSWRQFDQINGGKAFNPRYDRRHDISVVVTHELSKRLKISGVWVYGTGNAVSLPVGRFAVQGNTGNQPFVVPEYTSRNGFRLDNYHRFDISLVWALKPKRGESDLTFSLYNAYGRMNPFFVYFEAIRPNPDASPTGFAAKQVSLFPAIPAITYNFKF